MTDVKIKGGRPYLTEDQKSQRKKYLSQKLEPYLKSGLSVNKALKEAKIHNSELYKYLSEDELFGEKIARFKNYISVLLTYALYTELTRIVQRQIDNKSKGIMLEEKDVKFLCWFATHNSLTQEEYGRKSKKINSFDSEIEFQRLKNLIEESTNAHVHSN